MAYEISTMVKVGADGERGDKGEPGTIGAKGSTGMPGENEVVANVPDNIRQIDFSISNPGIDLRTVWLVVRSDTELSVIRTMTFNGTLSWYRFASGGRGEYSNVRVVQDSPTSFHFEADFKFTGEQPSISIPCRALIEFIYY